MANVGEYLAAGLLSGAGQAVTTAAGKKYEEQKAQADALRQKSMLDYQNKMSMDRQDRSLAIQKETTAENRAYNERQAADEKKYQSGLLSSSQAREDKLRGEKTGQAQRTIDTFDDKGNPITVSVDSMGRQVGETFSRGLTASELKQRGGGGGTGGGYENPLSDDARALVNRDFSTEIFKLVGEGESMDAFMVQNSVTGVPELNTAAVRAKYPEIADKYDALGLKVQLELQNTPNPEAAYSVVKDKIMNMTAAQAKKERRESIASVADETGATAETVEGIIGTEYTPKLIKDKAATLAVDSPEAKVLAIVNPSAYKAIAAEVRNSRGPSQKEISAYKNVDPRMWSNRNASLMSSEDMDEITQTGLLN